MPNFSGRYKLTEVDRLWLHDEKTAESALISAGVIDRPKTLSQWAYAVAKHHSFHKYPKQYPSNDAIRRCFDNWESHGTGRDRRYSIQGAGGRPVSVNTPEFRDELREHLLVNPSTTQAEMVNEFKVSAGTIHTAIKMIGFKPYKLRKCQVITPVNKRRRLMWGLGMKEKAIDDPDYAATFWYTDEAYLQSGQPHINTRNTRHYADSIESVSPDFYEAGARSQSGFRVSVWAAVCFGRPVYHHIWAEDKSVNGPNYKGLLQNKFFHQLRGPWRRGDGYQQDGAKPHTSDLVMTYLATKTKKVMSNRNWTIPGCETPPWPPTSPDLNPCDFWLWSVLRKKVYANKRPTSRNEFVRQIQAAFDEINADQDQINSAILNINKRIDLVVKCEGGIFENLL